VHPDNEGPSTPYTSSATSDPDAFPPPPFPPSSLEIKLRIPSKLNLDVSLSSGNIEIPKKLEGDDIHITTGDGNVIVSKVGPSEGSEQQPRRQRAA